jgi:hypothetical protein
MNIDVALAILLGDGVEAGLMKLFDLAGDFANVSLPAPSQLSEIRRPAYPNGSSAAFWQENWFSWVNLVEDSGSRQWGQYPWQMFLQQAEQVS